METKTDNQKDGERNKLPDQSGPQGVDKAPGEEVNRNEPVAMRDLKGKKSDGDPSKKEDQPVEPEDKIERR